MSTAISSLAPKAYPAVPAIVGVAFATVEATPPAQGSETPSEPAAQ